MRPTPQVAREITDARLAGVADLCAAGGDAADGASTLNEYAAANGVISGSVEGLDDMFNFDPSGTFAIDNLDLEVGQGSGHAWAMTWTFCGERGLFAMPTGVEGPHLEAMEGVTLFPNPSQHGAFLDLPGQGMHAVTVYDLEGRMISTVRNVTGRLAMPSLGAGNYLVHVQNDTERTTIKWMVK